MGSPIAQNFGAELHKAAWTSFTREGMERIPRVHQTVFDIRTSSNAKEEEILRGGLPHVPRVASDTVRTPQVSFSLSDPVVYRHNEYRYQYLYTKVAADDDQYGQIKGVISDMGEGMAYTIELEAAAILNDGQVGDLARGHDGLPLFHAAHTLIDSASTYSNIAASGGPTYAAVHVIHSYFRRVMSDVGFWTPVEIESLQVSPEVAPLWRQMLGALSAYSTLVPNSTGMGGQAAYTATANANEGIANIARTLGLTPEKVVENHYLANLEDVIVIGRDKKLRGYMREVPNSDTYDIPDPKAMAHRIQSRFTFGFTDARRVLLVPGS
jgi:hypothetical protein